MAVDQHDYHPVKTDGPDPEQEWTPIDLDRVLDEFEGDRTFIRELVHGFLKNAKNQVKVIGRGLETGDAESVRMQAHTIRGGALNIMADTLSVIATELENIGISGNLEKGPELLDKIRQQIRRIQEFAAGI
jgi:HPt (histidine-containing phosphotransfer) domain-containing protein